MKKEDLIKLKEKLSELSLEEERLRNLYLRKISLGEVYGPMVGYASIDKPWLKSYNENNIGKERYNSSAYEYMKRNNSDNLLSTSISYMNESLSYDKMLENIDIVTKSLLGMKIKKGDVVTLVMANIPENIYLFYALNRIGAIANMVDPRLKEDEIIEILKDTKSNKLISIDTFLNSKKIDTVKKSVKLDNIVLLNPLESLHKHKLLKFFVNLKQRMKINYKKYDILSWKKFIENGKDIELNGLPILDEEDAAVMVRTGGTTGKPKTVVLSNKNLNEMANQHALGEYNFEKGDIFLDFLPPFIAYGICAAMHMPLVLGLNLRLIPKFNAKIFPKLMVKYHPNVVFGGPILYEKMMMDKKTKNIDLSSLKVPVSGGDTMNIELEQKINDYFHNNNCNHHVGQGYGMTEVSSSACYSKEKAYCEGSVGIPLINNSIAIFDIDTMEEKQYGEEGEICIKTDTTMKSYLNNEIEYQKVIKIHADGTTWVHTGDIGKMNSSGNLFVVGRIKRIIVSDGSKIFPTEIENIISRHAEVLSCTVVGSKHKAYRSVPVAHIVLKEKNVDLDELVSKINAEIKEKLPNYYLPYTYVFRSEIPLTSIDKVDYKTLENETYSFKDKIIDETKKNNIKKRIRRRD